MSNNLQPETRGRWTGWRGTYLEAQGGGWRKEIGGSPGEGEEGGLILRQTQPRRRRWDRGALGALGPTRQLPSEAAGLEKRRRRRALTRLISASLLSCRALSKPNAFPPGGDKEAAGEAGVSPGRAPSARARFPRAADPTDRPVRTGGGRGTPGVGRGAGQRGDSGTYLGTCC